MLRPEKGDILLLVGTRKGLALLHTGPDRERWQFHGLHLAGYEINHAILDQRDSARLIATANSSWFGSQLQISDDFGETWRDPQSSLGFSEGSEKKVERLWHIEPGPDHQPGMLYAGVAPAALFRSKDRGETWEEVSGLNDHATREKWSPGAGGLMVHSIYLEQEGPGRAFVGISAAGVFRSDDGGTTWAPRNQGVLADFLPEHYPEVGQCVHHLVGARQVPGRLYQQNHCGVYRSDDAGDTWVDLSEGLPSRFGFVIAVHPHDPDTIFVVPEDDASRRWTCGGVFAVYRSRNRGETWEKLTHGLPQENAYLHLYREGMAVDSFDPFGLYVATATGEIFYSLDEGKSWRLLADWLPPIYSIEAAVME
jgi:photosystem II stability/assembly factor-like uncharacterized protein